MGNGVVILGADVTARVSANTLTVGGIQGDFVLTKDGAGILALSEAGSSTGGFVVSMGTLSVSGSGTLGLGNVTVNGGTLSLNNSIGIADTALLSINGGVVNLATGVNDTVGGLVLGGTVYTALGTYGGAGSGADYIHDTHFDGLGVITLVPVPEPGPAALLALAALAPWLARRRR
jgi:autotransporter-associated beta strand protein